MSRPASLDIRIIRELESPSSLQWNVRESYAAVAGKVGLDEETVRRRISRMRQSGVLKSSKLIINPHLIGREAVSLDLTVEDRSAKSSAISKIKLIDGVISILDFHGAGLAVGIYFRHQKELARQVNLMEAICDCKHSMLWHWSFPPGPPKVQQTDWIILSILHKDPRKRLADIAKEANVSSRTVNKKLKLPGRKSLLLSRLPDQLYEIERTGI